MNSLSNKVLEFVKSNISAGNAFTSQQVVDAINNMRGAKYPERNINGLLGIFTKQGYFTAKGYKVSEVGKGFKFAKITNKVKKVVSKASTKPTWSSKTSSTEYKVSSDGRVNLPSNLFTTDYLTVKIAGNKISLVPTSKAFNKETMIKNSSGTKVPARFLNQINAFPGSYVNVESGKKSIEISVN